MSFTNVVWLNNKEGDDMRKERYKQVSEPLLELCIRQKYHTQTFPLMRKEQTRISALLSIYPLSI